ncbi:hypothetical protein [Lederbergia lenta]|uniref:Uncharacterized protein n=1 Tax=Lederbergia lenta TaxID=1467 RepID=A0A2X4WG39_LEDLE|nr:hypothetical protein [Lederbergia lenta]MCM3113028.1 hypothetical protein [Lederbergia lenta]MEC2322754.1 hypothetical protein [Lederbergia lenta]SQI61789.1 Uncharacterised protein [Lederbergia lenta]
MPEQKPDFNKKWIIKSQTQEATFNVYLNDMLVAEVRGNIPNQQKVIPMRALSDYEEDKLHEYIASVSSEIEY